MERGFEVYQSNDDSMRALFLAFVTLVFSSCAPQGMTSVLPHKTYIGNNCTELKKVSVSEKEFIHQGERYGKVKQELINLLLVRAVQQTVGLEIKQRTSNRTELIDGKLNEAFEELNVEKARGYINAYQITEEKVSREGDMNFLSLSLTSDVCVPKNRFVKEIVAVGNITWAAQKNAVLHAARDLVSTAYYKNPRFDLVKGDTRKEYYDWLLTGRLIATNAQVTRSLKQSLGNTLMNTLMGTISRNSRPIVDDRVVRTTVTVYMQAEHAVDKTIISDSTTLQKDFPFTTVKNGLARKIDMLVEKCIVESTRKVFKKLEKRSLD